MSSMIEAREREDILRDLASPDEEMRRLAAERLLMFPVEEALPALVERLGDSSWRVRKAAVGRLVACPEIDAVVATLIAALADGENPGRRNSAVEALVEMGPSALDGLLSHLDSDDIDVRKLVVDAVAGIGDESARAAMIDTLADLDANVRAAAADALGVIGGAGVAHALHHSAVDQSEDRLVRFSSLRALARLEAPVSAAELRSVMDDSVLRPAAYALLGYVDDEEAISCLMDGIAQKSRASREAAIEALLRVHGRLDGDRATALAERIAQSASAEESVIPATIDRLADANLSCRLMLVQFLGMVRDPRVVVPILEAGRDEAVSVLAHATLEQMGEISEAAIDEAWSKFDVELCCHACDLLGRTTGARGTSRLEAALDDPDSQLRAAAARALGNRREASALPALVHQLEAAALSDELEAEEELDALIDALVALAAGFREEGSDAASHAIELLSSRLDGAPEAVRFAIATVLGRIGRHEDTELVAFLMKDPSAQVRRAAVEALARLEPGAASEPLRLALADEAAVVRIAAAGALGASENPKVLDDLQRLMYDDDARVRAAAVRAIGAHCCESTLVGGASGAVALLEHALADEATVAMAAIEALASAGGEEAGRAATRILDRDEEELVKAAVTCIGLHGEPAVISELWRLIPHPSWVVRAEVIQTLADRGVVQAVPSILRRLELEQDSFVRDTILRALKRLER